MTGAFSGADAYERFMGRWSRQLAPLFARFAGVRDGDALLDVGAGTGALSAALALVAPTSPIAGIDPSVAFVEVARAHAGNANVRFDVGDAQHIAFPDATFDRVLSLLAFNFVPDTAKALAEMQRVTRPGGTVAAAVWDYAGNMQMLRLFWDEAIALTPADDAKDERHMPCCREGTLAARWRAEGLDDVVEQALILSTPFESFDDYWRPFLEGQGPAGAYVAALTEPTRTALRERLRHRLTADGADRPFVLQARAWAVRGVVP